MSNQLIYALSSMGQVSFSRYKQLFKTLYRPESDEDEAEIDHRTMLTRMLDSLGYFEFDADASRVFMCPPSLVMLPTPGLPRMLLAGARTPALIAKIKAAVSNKRNMARISRQSQSKDRLNLPDAVFLEVADFDTARDIAVRSGLLLSEGGPAGWELALASVSIQDVEAKLDFVQRQEINWEKRVFDAGKLTFTFSGSRTHDENSLVEYTHPLTRQKMHWLWRGSTASEITRDWGRYLSVKYDGRKIVLYDETKKYLGVPLTVPLPRILARAAALCSGKAPYVRGIDCKEPSAGCDSMFYVYREVPQAVASIIAQKTGQEIISTRIELKREPL